MANAESAINPERIDVVRIIPFILIHLGCVGIYWVGVSKIAIAIAVLLYFTRMVGITAFYHRYFAHKTFKTNRFWQFIFAVIGASAAQRGPLWWAAHHRHHHAHSDKPDDPHSPVHNNFWHSHLTWFLTDHNFHLRRDRIGDFADFPELKFLDRFDEFIPAVLTFSLFGLGWYLNSCYPHLGTTGWQLVVWGFCVSTVLVMHATFCINSLAHKYGVRRYNTNDASRNNWWLALITLGEGWHNNHHHFPGTARQGFYWWEVDISLYVIKLLELFKIVNEVKTLPIAIRESRKIRKGHEQKNMDHRSVLRNRGSPSC